MTRRLKKFALSNYVKNPANSPYESSSASLVRARPAPYASAKRACFSMADWDPELYHRFRGYRAEPVERMLARLSVSARIISWTSDAVPANTRLNSRVARPLRRRSVSIPLTR
jgi:hypothetical protein